LFVGNDNFNIADFAVRCLALPFVFDLKEEEVIFQIYLTLKSGLLNTKIENLGSNLPADKEIGISK